MSPAGPVFYLLNVLRRRTFTAASLGTLRMYSILGRNRRTPGVVRCGNRDVKYVDAASCFSAWSAIFQDEIYRLKEVPSEPLFVDCGANIGLAVLYWAGMYPSAEIHAYEPDPTIFSVLQHNCSAEPGVTLHQTAVARDNSPVKLMSTGDDAGSILNNPALDGEQVEVSAKRLSDILKGFTRRVTLLKIDIEGVETEVLEEAQAELDRVDQLFVEYHGFIDQPQQLQQLLAVLNQSGFRYHLQTELSSPAPFRQINVETGMDQRINIYAWKPNH